MRALWMEQGSRELATIKALLKHWNTFTLNASFIGPARPSVPPPGTRKLLLHDAFGLVVERLWVALSPLQ
jgi:hypothetical protein